MKKSTIYKGMPKYDDEGNVIENIKRPTPFPAFNGNEEGINIIGFFTKDKSLARHFAKNYGEFGIVKEFSLLESDRVLTIDAGQQAAGVLQFGESGKPFRDAVRSGNFDVVEIKNTKDEGDVIVVLNEKLIKPVIRKQNRIRMR